MAKAESCETKVSHDALPFAGDGAAVAEDQIVNIGVGAGRTVTKFLIHIFLLQ